MGNRFTQIIGANGNSANGTPLDRVQGNISGALNSLQSALAGNTLPQNQTTISISGSTTAGTGNITGIADFTGLAVGKVISGSGIPSGATIENMDTVAGTMSVTAHIPASGSTTIQVAASAPATSRRAGVSPAISPFLGGILVSDVILRGSGSFVGRITSGSNQITSVTDFTNVMLGQRVVGLGMPSGTLITKIDSAATTLTLSQNATQSAVDASLQSVSDNLITHAFGQKPSVWWLMRQDSNAVVWEDVTPTLGGQSCTSNQINLRASSDCKVSVWIC